MTTSFALLMHGDVVASLGANPAGTLLALGLLLFAPWSLWASLRGRWPMRRWVEPYMIWGLVATLAVAATKPQGTTVTCTLTRERSHARRQK